MLIRGVNSTEYEVAEDCKLYVYDTKDKDLSFAIGHINGRFPGSGRTVNNECKELYYVISGDGVLHIEKDKIKLIKGDLFFIKPKKRYYLKGNSLVLALSTTPAWSQEQQEFVD